MKKYIFNAVFFILQFAMIIAAEAQTPPQHFLAGYIDITATGSAQKVDMADAKADGYNTVIFAFGTVNNTSAGFNPAYADVAKKAIADAKAQGMFTLVSFGGENNTFHVSDNMSKAQIDALAGHMLKFVQQYDLDGVDFDLEIKTNPAVLDDVIKSLKQQAAAANTPVYVTAAPQINAGRLVTTGSNEDYSQAIQAGDFDALFVQEYNTPPQNDPDFIVSSFDVIKGQVPAKTKIVVGEPVAAVAAGAATIYHPTPSTKLTTQQATQLILPRLNVLYPRAQFGGVMGWSLNVDYDAVDYGDPDHIPGTFAYGLKACVVGGQCVTPPNPKKPIPNYVLQTSNLSSSLGVIVDIQNASGKHVFVSDYLAPKSQKVYSKGTNPSIQSLEGKTHFSAQWKTYPGGPSGNCSSTFDMTANTNIMVNTNTSACDIKHF